jgi:glutamyl-tRNA reductase
MSVLIVGLNHQRASVELRERLALPELAQLRLLAEATSGDLDGNLPRELVVLSTCNRTELYAGGVRAGHEPAAAKGLADLLAAVTGVPALDFAEHLYQHSGIAAVRHLCRVAGGLDSMVPGEAEIQGQVARAFAVATNAGSVGTELNRMFRCARRAGRRVRAETAVGRGSASVGGEGARLIAEIMGPLDGRHILIVGTGKVGRLAGRALRGVAPGATVSVISRTSERAAELAERIGATALGWSDLVEAIRQADAILSATGAPHAVLTREVMERAIGPEGDGRARVIVDVAVPRDVEPAVREMPGITLRDLDDLQVRIERTLAARRGEVPAAEQVIDEELAHLKAEIHDAEVRPLLSDLRARADAIRERELERLWRRLGTLAPDLRHEIEMFSDSLLRKLLHDPTRLLRETHDPDAARVYTSVTRALFGLGKTPQ